MNNNASLKHLNPLSTVPRARDDDQLLQQLSEYAAIFPAFLNHNVVREQDAESGTAPTSQIEIIASGNNS